MGALQDPKWGFDVRFKCASRPGVCPVVRGSKRPIVERADQHRSGCVEAHGSWAARSRRRGVRNVRTDPHRTLARADRTPAEWTLGDAAGPTPHRSRCALEARTEPANSVPKHVRAAKTTLETVVKRLLEPQEERRSIVSARDNARVCAIGRLQPHQPGGSPASHRTHDSRYRPIATRNSSLCSLLRRADVPPARHRPRGGTHHLRPLSGLVGGTAGRREHGVHHVHDARPVPIREQRSESDVRQFFEITTS
jgi:hypothetical protein